MNWGPDAGDRPNDRGLRLAVVAVGDIAREYWAHRPMELAAALSYYTILAVAPLVLITVAVE